MHLIMEGRVPVDMAPGPVPVYKALKYPKLIIEHNELPKLHVHPTALSGPSAPVAA